MKTVLITQSNYIPWKGYFDAVHRADELILYDDVQYTRRDWRNRNRIKTAHGPRWLTIPVEVKGRYLQTIDETRVSAPDWPRKHWRALSLHYARAACFAEHAERFEELYLGCREPLLSRVNHRFLVAINELLGIRTTISWSRDYAVEGDRTERLLALCKAAGATEYLTGPAARSYLDEDLFRQEKIAVTFLDYGGYPEYRQLYPPFEHAVSIVDLILNEGRDAPRFMKSFG
jgi:hypothetical protein